MTDPIDHNAAYRREDLERLRRASPHALWTRDTFILEFGEPVHVTDPELVDLAGRDEGDRCPHCTGQRFVRETYLTDRAGVRVAFWWCDGCGLGRRAGVGSLD
jgi:hypothetical protein